MMSFAGIARTIISSQQLPRKVLAKQTFILSHAPPPDCASLVIVSAPGKIQAVFDSSCGWSHCAVSIEKRAVKRRSDSEAWTIAEGQMEHKKLWTEMNRLQKAAFLSARGLVLRSDVSDSKS